MKAWSCQEMIMIKNKPYLDLQLDLLFVKDHIKNISRQENFVFAERLA